MLILIADIPLCLKYSNIIKYSRAPVSTDSVSAVYSGPEKIENETNKGLISFKTRAKRERAVTW
jgi:hypothetical protein